MILTPNQAQHASRVTEAIRQNVNSFSSVIPQNFLRTKPYFFDFSKTSPEMQQLDLNDLQELIDYLEAKLRAVQATWGAGGYGEDRAFYQVSPLFTQDGEARSVHLAVDLWLPAGTRIFAPLAGRVHSFRDNNNFRDYGPTIILEHKLGGIRFYTLYGHLSRASLAGLSAGQDIRSGEGFAEVGSPYENGQWPPHLHFQIISDLLGKVGDFPGVARPSERNFYLTICPNPNLMLRIPGLPD